MKYQWCMISDIFLEDIYDLPSERELEFDGGERLVDEYVKEGA